MDYRQLQPQINWPPIVDCAIAEVYRHQVVGRLPADVTVDRLGVKIFQRILVERMRTHVQNTYHSTVH
ncbi:hypothetical protein NECAME_11582 [Necator americanus]|uniref:Uncharacterized protein n=1 Tax=Necator americanus TaxID=51031 RepID=W2T6G3_NECAM|nr:hypothetical protein NECAME_11582 [Necator americanus]ETN76577.1 hypothetical protein NECAME_11582 [Necator americanus]